MHTPLLTQAALAGPPPPHAAPPGLAQWFDVVLAVGIAGEYAILEAPEPLKPHLLGVHGEVVFATLPNSTGIYGLNINRWEMRPGRDGDRVIFHVAYAWMTVPSRRLAAIHAPRPVADHGPEVIDA